MVKETRSTCGAAKLLAAVFDKDLNEVKAKLGLPTEGVCKECGSAIWRDNKSGICQRCKREKNQILLVCSQCGRSFYRYGPQIVYRIGKRNHQYTFCSRQCAGEFVGLNYGFHDHPENGFYGHPENRDRGRILVHSR
jgi:hypothetical protein